MSKTEKHATGWRFKQIADEVFEGNVSELARKMNMSPQSLNKYVQGECFPGGVIAERLARLGINLNWLYTGLGSMLINEVETSINAAEEKNVKSDFPSAVLGYKQRTLALYVAITAEPEEHEQTLFCLELLDHHIA
jgi:transcriptional regulator with XRE-family HTH domain